MEKLTTNSELPIIFIVGNSRSGTTMLSRILGRSKQVLTLNELHFFENIWEPSSGSTLTAEQLEQMATHLWAVRHDRLLYMKSLEPHRPAAKEWLSLQPAALHPVELLAQFLLHEAKKGGASIPCEQTPRNVLFLNEILGVLGNARAISMVRDPRDVLLSQKNKFRRKQLGWTNMPLKEQLRLWANYHPITIALIWRASVASSLRSANHEHHLMIRFEDLIREPEATLQRICSFADITYEAQMLEIPVLDSSQAVDIQQNVGVDSSKGGQWRKGGLSNAEIWICQRICHNAMGAFGYEMVTKSQTIFPILWQLLSWPLYTALSLLLNLSRMRNIFHSIRRRLG